MSAGNAFAALQGQPSTNGDGKENARPFKKARTSRSPATGAWAPQAQGDTALEVDTMILDYVTLQAIRSCLESRKPVRDGAAGAQSTLGKDLELAGSFTTVFKARHPTYKPDAELRLRLILLRLTTLFTQRLTLNPTTPDRSSLEALRQANRERAKVWNGNSRERMASAGDNDFLLDAMDPIPLSQLERNRAHVLNQLSAPAEDEDYEDAFYGTLPCVSLLDLLPLFVQVSAASINLNGGTLTDRWMNIACEFMVQACLEQYLVYGATGPNVLDEAFAWGYEETEAGAREDAGGHAAGGTEVNDMFEDDTYATEVEGWGDLRSACIAELATGYQEASVDGHEGLDTASHLESVASRHPVAAFETSILKFLEALSLSIPTPVLVQLERGSLDGMTEKATQDFLHECGVAPM